MSVVLAYDPPDEPAEVDHLALAKQHLDNPELAVAHATIALTQTVQRLVAALESKETP